MVYHMAKGFRAAIVLFILIAGLAVSSGCLSTFFGPPPAITRPPAAVTATPSPESPTATLHAAEMALAPEDIAGDYSLRDRSVIAYDEVGQLSRDMGWIQGYRVVYYHQNLGNDDVTGIRQVIAIYPLESINRVYSIEKDSLLLQENGTKKYMIPFPRIGDKSIAIRVIEPEDPRDMVVYSVLFVKKNVCEQITMGGTTTDYESLKSLAIRAADRIH